MQNENTQQYQDDHEKFYCRVNQIVRNGYISESFIDHYKTPDLILKAWKDAVESGVNYDHTIFEWDNDISIRGLIEMMILDEELKKITHWYNDFKIEIEKIDLELKKITLNEFERPNCQNWWEKRVLKDSEGEYKEHIKIFYSIDLDDYKNQ